jgi:aspartate/methionine/tyrosine aminotransferase
MQYKRMPIEVESPEQMGYDKIKNNLSESSYTDARFRDLGIGGDLKRLVLAYGPHAGHEGIRTLLTKDNPSLTKDDVLLTIGAAAGLFIIATSLLEKDDELVVVRPNYATNIETPGAIGAHIKYVDLHFEEDFALDIKKIKSLLTKRTKYISVTYPHNPTGVCLAEPELKELIALAERNNTRLLVDETYRDMVFGQQLPLAAGFSPNVISISSLSKTYGLPGIRVGWIICRDGALLETFLAAKEQIHICGSVLDEQLAFHYLQHKDRHLKSIRKDIRNKFDIVKRWIEDQGEFEWVEPKGGAVCFPRMRYPDKVDIEKFYDILQKKYGTYTGPGHWFGQPRHYMRIGYGWPDKRQLQEGLKAMSKSIKEASRR